MRPLKYLCKLNKEVTNDLCDEMGVEREQLFKILNKEEFNRMVREAVEKEAKNFLGRRSFLEALALGAGITIGSIGLAKGDVLITNDNVIVKDPSTGLDWDLRVPMPFSAIVGIEGNNIRAYDWKGGLIDSSRKGVDDAKVIQNGIDFVEQNGGGKIIIKEGKYIIKEQIVKEWSEPNPPLIIESENAELIADVFTSPVDAIIKFNYTENVEYVYNPIILKGLILDVNGQKQPVNSNYQFAGIYLRRIWNAKVEQCYIKNAVWAGIVYYGGIVPSSADFRKNLLVEHCIFENCGLEVNNITPQTCCYGGIYVTLGGEGTSINNCKFKNCYQGIVIEDKSGGCHIYKNNIEGSVEAGIHVYYSYFVNCNGNYLINNKNGIVYDGDSRFGTIVENRCYNNSYYGIYVASKQNIISKNICYYNGDTGIVVANSYNSIIGNLSMHNGWNSNATYKANVVLDSTYNRVISNMLRRDGALAGWDVVSYGIIETVNANYNEIYMNDVRGNPTPISITGLNTVIKNNIGYPTKSSGTVTITGDGVTTTFTVDIAHGLVSDKVVARITLDRDGSVDKVYLVDKDGDGFKETLRVQVTYATAPANGETVPIYWEAEVVG